MKNSTIVLFLLHFALLGLSQEVGYEVRGTYKKPILKEKLNAAKTMSDINPGYPSSWISGYISAQVWATCNGVILQAVSANDTLSNEQINILKNADLGSEVTVEVKYNPNNSLNAADIKTVNFTSTIVPKVEAEYIGGYEELKKYLKENAIDEIDDTTLRQIKMTTILFTVSDNGGITDAHVSKTSGYENIDELLLEVIQKMPKWNPAEDAEGLKVKQEFRWSVGYEVGC